MKYFHMVIYYYWVPIRHGFGASLARWRCRFGTSGGPVWHFGFPASHGTVSDKMAPRVSLGLDRIDFHSPDPFLGSTQSILTALDQSKLFGFIDGPENGSAADAQEGCDILL
jgi:hypothetical protein